MVLGYKIKETIQGVAILFHTNETISQTKYQTKMAFNKMNNIWK